MNWLVDQLVTAMPRDSVYPAGVVEPIKPRLRGRAFFPGGSGLFGGATQAVPERPIMLVGQDFGNVDYWRSCGSGDEAADGTWAHLVKLLRETRIDPALCYFTNALLGVRVGTDIEGPSPGLSFSSYVDACMGFLEHQIRVVRPVAVVGLGIVPTTLLARRLAIAPSLPMPTPTDILTWKEVDAKVEAFVARVQPEGLPAFAFATSVHPVRYWLNEKRRSWKSRSLHGVDASQAIWSEVRRLASPGA